MTVWVCVICSCLVCLLSRRSGRRALVSLAWLDAALFSCSNRCALFRKTSECVSLVLLRVYVPELPRVLYIFACDFFLVKYLKGDGEMMEKMSSFSFTATVDGVCVFVWRSPYPRGGTNHHSYPMKGLNVTISFFRVYAPVVFKDPLSCSDEKRGDEDRWWTHGERTKQNMCGRFLVGGVFVVVICVLVLVVHT